MSYFEHEHRGQVWGAERIGTKAVADKISTLITEGLRTAGEKGKTYDTRRILSGKPGPDEVEFLRAMETAALSIASQTNDPLWREAAQHIRTKFLAPYRHK
jgi:hypothetical protein